MLYLFLFTLDTMWGCDSLQKRDPDGTIAFVDILLYQLAEQTEGLLKSDLNAENKLWTIETLLLTVFDVYWQSELKMKEAVAELIGDKYIQCFIGLERFVVGAGEYNSSTMTH